MTHNTALILPFSEIRAADLPLVGGKGANLGEMTAAGFPVPAGFCLTTAAFQQFMNACPDPDVLYHLLDSVTTKDVKKVGEAAEQIRKRLLDVPMPAEISQAIRETWQSIGADEAYAVRSSATAEDLPDASFAGQHDTYLNISGEKALLEAVRKCWVSLFTDRAILYRTQNNFAHRRVALSVVVQQMIMAEKAGILFTADPLTGHRHTLVIDASLGLGEALVGGLVTPDSYRVDKRTRIITDRQIADKEIGIFPEKAGGTRQIPLSEAQRGRTVLADRQILALADLGARVEAHYGAPQDIEWAIADSQIYLLQSRPITSLYPIDGLTSPDDSLHIFVSMGHQQSMTRAMSPLGLSTIRMLLPSEHSEGIVENSYIRTSGGRIFADITKPLRHPIGRRAMLRLLSQLDALAPEMVRQAMQRPEFQGPHGLHPSLRTLKGAAGLIRRVLSALGWRDLTGFADRTNCLMDNFVEDIAARLDMSPGKKQLQAALDGMPHVFPFFLNWVPEAVSGIVAMRLLTRLSGRWLTPQEREVLTLGIPGNVVNEMNLAIGDLADLVRHNPHLVDWFDHLGNNAQAWLAGAVQIKGSDPFLKAWNDFLCRYGSRGPSEIDIMMPRWREEPLPVLQVIASALQQNDSYRARFQAFVDRRQATYEKLLTAAGSGPLGGLRTHIFERLYHVMTKVGGMREHHKFLAVRIIALVKEVLKGVDPQLVAAGKLAALDDLWFLNWRELVTIWEDEHTNWAALIARRRAELERYQKLTPGMIITSDGESPVVQYRMEDAPPGALLGNPVSAGVAEGVAHVIRDPQSETLAPGEILVTEFTDPGWTPLFLNASGVVLEVGGALTHGAILAREYGIPAVVGVREATQKIQTGQRLRVDGNRGVVS